MSDYRHTGYWPRPWNSRGAKPKSLQHDLAREIANSTHQPGTPHYVGPRPAVCRLTTTGMLSVDRSSSISSSALPSPFPRRNVN